MKLKQDTNILFLSNLSSINFAWHFLNNTNIFSTQEQILTNNEETLKIHKLKPKLKFKAVVCLKDIPKKQCEEILNMVEPKTQIITNNISCFLKFKQLKANIVFCEVAEEKQKTTLVCSEQPENIFQNISLKTDNIVINKNLSKTLINVCVGGISTQQKKGVGSLVCNPFKQKKIINIMAESIKLTNSVMLTCEKYKGFDFYKFLSGKGLSKKIKQYFKMLSFLYSIKDKKFEPEQVKSSIKALQELNFNNYCELKHINNLLKQMQNNQV